MQNVRQDNIMMQSAYTKAMVKVSK